MLNWPLSHSWNLVQEGEARPVRAACPAQAPHRWSWWALEEAAAPAAGKRFCQEMGQQRAWGLPDSSAAVDAGVVAVAVVVGLARTTGLQRTRAAFIVPRQRGAGQV